MSLRTNPAPCEAPRAREAIVEGYKALRMLAESGLLTFIAEKAHDPKAAQQCVTAMARLEAMMSPNLLCTVLPAYTKVRFQTDQSREGHFTEGMLRDGAWGLFPDERGQQALERRITTTGDGGGFEFFVTPETVFTFFEVTEYVDREMFSLEFGR